MSIKHKRRIKYGTLIFAPAVLIALAIIAAISIPGSSAVADYNVPAEYQTCTECHDDTTLITGKVAQWEESGHGTGTAFVEEGPNKSCVGCHSGGGFSAMIAAGQKPNQPTVGDPNPTPQNCRACHQTHETYTGIDWALETVAPVGFYMLPDKTFDGGQGNLCANCHQPRKAAPAVAAGGTVTGITNRFGPHHGPQSSMMIGTGGAGAEGTSAAHYQYVENTCVGCHMGSTDNHTTEPNLATCKGCHTTATSFDVNGVQTATQAKLDTLKGLLLNAGVLNCTVDAEGAESCVPPTASFSAPQNVGYALWNWILINNEDGSKGVHNPQYTQTLLDNSIASIACDGEPALSLGVAVPFWASYADYTTHLLSVTYPVSNNGSGNAFSVNITNSSATNGVTLASSLPAPVGNIAAGASSLVTLQYNVPADVGSFHTTNSATAKDNCGSTFTYGT